MYNRQIHILCTTSTSVHCTYTIATFHITILEYTMQEVQSLKLQSDIRHFLNNYHFVQKTTLSLIDIYKYTKKLGIFS